MCAPHTPVVSNPDDNYFRLLLAELDAANVSVDLDPKGGRRLVGITANLKRPTVEAVKRHGDGLVNYLVKIGRLAKPEPVRQYPKPGSIVVWLDNAGEYHVCTADELPDAQEWVRWRYRNGRRWFAYSGDSWEE